MSSSGGYGTNEVAPVGAGGIGEMAARVAAFDWSRTPLGPAERWPQSLRVAVGICLNSRFPMFVWWGPGLINIYNDAYIPVLGKRHPAALGLPAREIWQEIWPVIGPQADAVMARGEATWNERTLLVMERHGYAEETFFTWSYSPIPDESGGGVGGLFCACTEETARVRAEERVTGILASIQDGFATFDREWRFVFVNAEAERLLGMRREELLGRSYWALLPATVGTPIEGAYRRAVAEQATVEVEAFYAPWARWFYLRCYPTAEGGLSVFFQDVTARKQAEARRAARAALGERLREQRDAGGIARAAAEILGRTLGVARAGYGAVNAAGLMVHVADDWTAAGADPATAGAHELATYWPGLAGELRRGDAVAVDDVAADPRTADDPGAGAYTARGARAVVAVPVVAGGGVTAVLYAEDGAPRAWSEGELAFAGEVAGDAWAAVARVRAEAAVRESEARYRNFVRLSSEGIWRFELDEPVPTDLPEDAQVALIFRGAYLAECNDATARMYGYAAAADMVGRRLPEFQDPADPGSRAFILAFIRGGYRLVDAESREPDRDGNTRVFLNSFVGWTEGGALVRAWGTQRDVTDERRATERVNRIHAVSAALSEALTTADVARVAVEQGIGALGASAGSLSLLSDDGTALEMAGHVGYPADVIARWQRFPLDAPIPLTDAVRRGEPIYLTTPQERLARYPALAAVRATRQTEASACVPLMVGGRAVGVLGLGFDHASLLSPGDREFIVSLARQCAQALERARLFDAELRARAEAERANDAKSEFIAALSHELRTPLTPVLLTVSVLEAHAGLPPDLRADVASIRRNVELESRLISDLLDLTRITRGKLQLDASDIDLHAIVRDAIDVCQREASARMVVDLAAPRHTVHGDPTRLQQVFWNLINNAIKFTPPEGTITVRSSAVAPADGAPARLRVEVIDTGAGIDAGVLPRLFSAFEQGDARAGRQLAGLGLGLAISRRLAEAHGGTIVASSAGRGRGATFAVELPVVDAPAPATPPTRPALQSSADRALSVLLIEDHEPTLAVMARLLRSLGHRVTATSTVAAGTAAARRDGFDLIISDLGLPDGSGLDVMRQLRDRYAGRAIALTGYGMDSDIAASREAGFVEHLTKPVDLAALEAAIRRAAGGGTR